MTSFSICFPWNRPWLLDNKSRYFFDRAPWYLCLRWHVAVFSAVAFKFLLILNLPHQLFIDHSRDHTDDVVEVHFSLTSCRVQSVLSSANEFSDLSKDTMYWSSVLEELLEEVGRNILWSYKSTCAFVFTTLHLIRSYKACLLSGWIVICYIRCFVRILLQHVQEIPPPRPFAFLSLPEKS